MFDMDCDRWMESISALYDDEEPPIPRPLIRLHLEDCARCHAYERSLRAFRRSAVYNGASHRPTEDVRRRIAEADRASRPLVLRLMLAFVAVEMIVVVAGPLVARGDVNSISHPIRHAGAFTLAYAAAMLVAVARPARAAAMLPVAVVLVSGVALNVAFDVANGHASLASEWTHVPELITLPLVWLLRTPRATRIPSDGRQLEWRPGSSWRWSSLRGVLAQDRASKRALRALGDDTR